MKKATIVVLILTLILQVHSLAGPPVSPQIVVVGAGLECAGAAFIIDMTLASAGSVSNYNGTVVGSLLPLATMLIDPKQWYGKNFNELMFKYLTLQLLGGSVGHYFIK